MFGVSSWVLKGPKWYLYSLHPDAGLLVPQAHVGSISDCGKTNSEHGTVHVGNRLTKSLHESHARISYKTVADTDTISPALELDMTARSKTAFRVTIT